MRGYGLEHVVPGTIGVKDAMCMEQHALALDACQRSAVPRQTQQETHVDERYAECTLRYRVHAHRHLVVAVDKALAVPARDDSIRARAERCALHRAQRTDACGTDKCGGAADLQHFFRRRRKVVVKDAVDQQHDVRPVSCGGYVAAPRARQVPHVRCVDAILRRQRRPRKNGDARHAASSIIARAMRPTRPSMISVSISATIARTTKNSPSGGERSTIAIRDAKVAMLSTSLRRLPGSEPAASGKSRNRTS